MSDEEVATLLEESSRWATQRPSHRRAAFSWRVTSHSPRGLRDRPLRPRERERPASPRNQSVAHRLNQAGLGTLLFDLLTPAEALDRSVYSNPLPRRPSRCRHALAGKQAETRALRIGYFGASTGAAAALWAAADNPSVRAIVSRGGRPDLAGRRIAEVRAPTLLIVGGDDRSSSGSTGRPRPRCDAVGAGGDPGRDPSL